MSGHVALEGGRRPEGLCHLVSDFRGRIPHRGCIVEPKIDGIRMLWIDGELVTRDGVPILGADHIAAELRRLEHETVRRQFFDGEWQVNGSFDATLAHFKARGTRGDAGVYHLFDMLDIDTWRGLGVSLALRARKRRLDELCAILGTDSPVRPVPWGWVHDTAEVWRVADAVIDAGGEGVVLKYADSTYLPGRSGNWQRIKASRGRDGRIVELIPDAENGDRLAAMIVDLDGRRVAVSTGFSDRQRFDFLFMTDRLIGGIVEIEPLEDTGTDAPSGGRFLRLREGPG